MMQNQGENQWKTLNFNGNKVNFMKQAKQSPSNEKLFPQQKNTPFQVVQKFKTETNCQDSSLEVELQVYFNYTLSKITTCFQIFEGNYQEILVKNTAKALQQNTNSFSSLGKAQQEGGVGKKTNYNNSENKEQCDQQTVKIQTEQTLLKCTPFKRESQCYYDYESMNIQERLEQTNSGLRCYTVLRCKNVEVSMGFDLEICRDAQQKQQQQSFEQEYDNHNNPLDMKDEIESEDITAQHKDQDSSADYSNSETTHQHQANQQQQQSTKVTLAELARGLGNSYQTRNRKISADFDLDQTTADHSEDYTTSSFQVSQKSKRIRKVSTSSVFSQYNRKRKDSQSFSDVEEMGDPTYKVPTSYQSGSSNKKKSTIAKKGDKKNVVKNFIKAFRSWINTGETSIIMELQGYESQEQLKGLRSEWKIFEDSSRYNNKLIKQLIQKNVYQKLFSYFLNNVANSWLKNSQVQDKSAHSEVLKGYIQATQNPDQLDSIVILKSRN